MKPVLCFGDICPDILIPYGAACDFRAGLCVDTNSLTVTVGQGGSVANTCVGLARQDVPVMFCGCVGNDNYGKILKTGLEADNVDVSLMKVSDDVPTILVLIIVDGNGERTAFACPRVGASQHYITKDQIPNDIEKRISWLHCGGITLREEPSASVQLELMRRCKAQGVPVSFDVNARLESASDAFFARNVDAAICLCDYLTGSEHDEILPLLKARNLDNPSRLCKTVVLRSGKHGAKVISDGTTYESSAFKVEVRDTVGAGDAYNAGFIAALLKGSSLAEANVNACATAALCVSGLGGRALPTTSELKAFLSAY